MADPLDDDALALQVELDAVVAGADAVAPGQRTAERASLHSPQAFL